MPAIEPLYCKDITRKEAERVGWKRVGEVDDGRPIWQETVEVTVGKEPIVINGETQWVMAGQQPIKPKLRRVVEMQTREFILEKQPNGGEFKNYHFRPDPDEAKRLERTRKVKDFQTQLAEKMVERDLSVDDLLSVIGQDTDETKPRRTRKSAA